MNLHEFLVPDVGEGLAEVEIVEWHVNVGDDVREHQAIASVETDKAVIELPSPYTGLVRELHGEPGDRLPVGGVLAVVEMAASTAPTAAPRPQSAVPELAAQPQERPSAGATREAPRDGALGASGNHSVRPRASPAVRRLARELGVDLATVTPTGKGGLVVAKDVRAVVDRDADTPATPSHSLEVSEVTRFVASKSAQREPELVQLRGLRRTIARNMAVVAQIPHITSQREIDASALLEWRRQVNERRTPDRLPLTLTPFLALCVIGALRAVPQLNATFDAESEELLLHTAVHLGVAVATDDGLLVPVLHDADLKGVEALADEIDALAASARERTLRPEQMAGGTFTITNYGSQGGWFGTPLLRIPEIGIAGFGRIAERPWVVDGQLAVTPILPLSVSVDHRIIDGDVLGHFGDALASFLTEPLKLRSVASAW